MIKLQNVYKSFNNKPILNNINLQVGKGEILSIVGPSGVGKTTLLRCIKQLDLIDSGKIFLDGIDIYDAETNKAKQKLLQKIGYVFQELYLFSNFTVRENLDLPLKVVRKIPKLERNELIDNLLSQMQILDKKDCYPYQLSGGQKQRVAIARTLAMEPEAILFDEPTSALDSQLKGQAFELIMKLAKQKDLAIIIVTHEIELAKKFSNKVASLKGGTIL
jgi:ABC-type polar amino acid transport system ATPase subunit